ncbi:uncharacterized protein LOC141595378 [Silene latifolia]|uniref:uncharacterized protein LOC141595378 n=1 Tax=Silene latifolia TaxID=37657 RepID=UPI003D772E83
MGTRRNETKLSLSLKKIGKWVRNRKMKEKVIMGAISGVMLFIFLMFYVEDYFYFFLPSRFAHAAGLLVLLYKLHRSKTCAGLSLKSQELTAIQLVVRLVCSVVFQRDIHIYLDLVTLCATLWVIYVMRIKLKSTYMKDLDSMPLYYVLVPCAIASILAHPRGHFSLLIRFLWPFSMAVEAISVLPQLRLMQNAKMVEPFTGHYVFALGVSRFFQCAYWIIQIIDSRGQYLMLIGSGHFWILLALTSEVVQTFILADFCYYYIKSVMAGQLLTRLPSLV